MIPINNKNLTYGDVIALDLPSPHYELIDGVLVAMAGVSALHSQITVELSHLWHKFWSGRRKEYRVFVAPFDVILFPDSEDIKKSKLAVQPDMCVALTSSIKNNTVCGAPLLVVEILSTNYKHDLDVKYKLYEKAQVPEYWVIDPKNKLITIYVLFKEAYRLIQCYSISDGDTIVRSETLDYQIDITEMFNYEGIEDN
jgi:Uma2 family endonuclease